MKQKRNITEGIRKFNVPLVLGVIFVVWIIVTFWQEGQYRTTIEALTSISPEQVTKFRIYPRVGVPVDTSIEFMLHDSIIADFFQALTDQRSYSYSHDTVASRDHSWFLEIIAGELFIQISFHIPHDNDNIVAGMLGKFTKNSTTSYGHFQSRQLYQWYQRYSHRWLTPEGTPPAPSP
ncbi:hypothetical protein U14_05814 [Candidatus Moduliflexus flocculans]|uniref:Uncharacterized protein n=1 Tax=Candidatus Moduliflexus flocculans TaxID=1499966 RepID=A0A081BSZ6_9BACT|nr:hypothetical protein U14_05814 [Candidatus Moduliflexus flocculans]